MFVVEAIARIRRAHCVQGKSIKAICRELRVSRKTVRKVIRSEATEFHYERDEQPMPRLRAWRETPDALRASNEAKLRSDTAGRKGGN
jgi:transposase-like protein